MDRIAIVDALARGKVVETIVANIARQSVKGDLLDLVQMVYETLLTYNESMVVEMWERGEISFFITRIVKNNYESTTSPYYREIVRFKQTTQPISNNDTQDY